MSKSSILLVMDELISYNNLPKNLLKQLPGYNSFKKIGIEFTNIHANRQMCSPSRASFMTSTINTGIQSNIDQPYQYFFTPNLSFDAETIAKSLKSTYPDILTGYFGKEHLSSQLSTNLYITPAICTNTSGVYKSYGFDRGSIFGDSFYKNGHGYCSDNTYFNTIINNTLNNVDLIDKNPLTDEVTGFIGVIPFLKARKKDNKQYHLSFHLTNPHDTQQFWQNYSQIPISEQSQYSSPFLKEQTTDQGYKNPYFYNDFFPDAYIKDNNLTKNFFEDNFNEYSTNTNLLPFLESFTEDYSTSSNNNPINEYYSSLYQGFILNFTMADDQNDIKSWKNLINNYYGLIIEADKYVFKIYKFLKNNDMLDDVSVIITSDHGDAMSAHGLKQKGLPFRECVNIPFIVYSSKIPNYLQGEKNNILGSLLDLAPTIDVLMNIKNKNINFLGKSLMKNVNNFLIPRNKNEPVISIFNDFMNSQSCIIDPNYNDTFFNFKFCFNMIIDYNNDKNLYKFGRFFSIYELFSYNFKYNTLIPLLTHSLLFSYNNLFFINKISEIYTNNLSNFLFNLYKDTPFQFNDAFNEVKTTFGKNSLELILFIIFISNFLKFYTNYEFIIPGVFNDFETILNSSFKNGGIDFFCYNLTDDPYEVKNIFYKKNEDNSFSYNSSKKKLFTKLNYKLNNLTINKCMTSSNNLFTFIIPTNIYEIFFICIFKFGPKTNEWNLEQRQLAFNSLFLNNHDSMHSQIKSIETIILECINLSIT